MRPVEVDWQPALECARFERIRKNPNEQPLVDTSSGSIVPSWDEAKGQPYIKGVYVRFDDDLDQDCGMLIPSSIFKDYAKQLSCQLVQEGKLELGETFQYRVCAYSQPPATALASPSPAIDLTIEPLLQPLDLVEQRLDVFTTPCEKYGPACTDEPPVFIPRRVLQEAVRLTERAGAVETGGVLIGHLYRDPQSSVVYVRVTAQVPARHAEQSLTKLTFTPQVWAHVEAAIGLRKRNEIYLGWWHSHPARQWCKDCPIENRKRCKLSGEFFSGDDAALHRCVFPRAYSVALVISDSYATGLTWPLFGWNRGVIMQRGYLICDDEAALHPVANTVVNH